jgi:SpoVK/Ycf46/Vps4 family AAA+-type ATPase
MDKEIETPPPLEDSSSMPVRKLPLREFLENEGIIGFPSELETTLDSILLFHDPLYDTRRPLYDVLKDRKVKTEKGILISGPPGVGKSTLAYKLAEYFNCTGERLQVVSAPQLFSGEKKPEENIKALFEPAKKAFQKLGNRSPLYIVIINNMEAIAPRQHDDDIFDSFLASNSNNSDKLDVFLAFIQEFSGSNLLLIGISDGPNKIDNSLLKPGKFGPMIEMKLPSMEQRQNILSVYFRVFNEKKLISEDVDIKKLARATTGMVVAELLALMDKVNNLAAQRLRNAYFREGIANEKIGSHPAGMIYMNDFVVALKQFGREIIAESKTSRPISFRQFLQQEGFIGLPTELETTLTPIFSTFGPLKDYLQDLDIKPEKGILLCGPPGTGKTTFARKLAQYLHCKDDQIKMVSGSELLDAFEGNTEQAIRDLFAPAQKAAKDLGELSPLFVIIIDEFDSIGSNRGNVQHDWERTKVNQLLTSLDGFLELPNLLFIGITNFQDKLDPALLRPGRLGTIIEMKVPTKEQRKELLEVYTKALRKNGLLSSDVDMNELAEFTTGFTGADIKGLIDKIKALVLTRVKTIIDSGDVKVEEIRKHPASSAEMLDFLEVIHQLRSQKKKLLVKSRL